MTAKGWSDSGPDKNTPIRTTGQLQVLLAAVAAGTRPLIELDEAAARLGEWVSEDDQDLFDLWGGLELRLAEWSNGDLDEAELRVELRKLIDPDLA